MIVLCTQTGWAKDLHWAELDYCIVDEAKKDGVTTNLQRRHPFNAWLGLGSGLGSHKPGFFVLLICICTIIDIFTKYHNQKAERENNNQAGRTEVLFCFVFHPFSLHPSVSGLEKSAPEKCSRCLTFAPTGYLHLLLLFQRTGLRVYRLEKVGKGWKGLKGHFSVSSPTSRSSQISDQPLLFMANLCKITYRCHLYRYAGPLANHNKSNTIHALYGLSNYDYGYSGSLGRCLMHAL